MYYKRKESFRYTFGSPVQGKIQDLENYKKTEMHLLDLSPQGARIEIRSSEEIWRKDTQVQIFFELLNEKFVVKGLTKWIKTYGSSIQYGLVLQTDDATQQSIVNCIKQIARNSIQ